MSVSHWRLGNVGRLGVNIRAHNLVVEQLAEPDSSLAGRLFGPEPGGDPAFDLQVFRERDSEAVQSRLARWAAASNSALRCRSCSALRDAAKARSNAAASFERMP
jgi:hypothetical protein